MQTKDFVGTYAALDQEEGVCLWPDEDYGLLVWWSC